MEVLGASLDNSLLCLVLTSNLIICHPICSTFDQLLIVYNLHHHTYHPVCLLVLTFSFAMMPSKSHCNTPYDSPYKVLCRLDKHYILEINGKWSTISLDRLKPACLEPYITPTPSITPTNALPTPLQRAQPPRTTRSGRRVHFPDRYGTILTFVSLTMNIFSLFLFSY